MGHSRCATGARLSQALRLGHRAQRPYPSGDSEGRRQCEFPHGHVHRLSAAEAGGSAGPGAVEGRSGRARQVARYPQRQRRSRIEGARADRCASRSHGLRYSDLARQMTGCGRLRMSIRSKAMAALARDARVAFLIGSTLLLAGAPGPAWAADTVTIEISNYSFIPPDVTVAPGTKVVWVNHDEMVHTIVSTDRLFGSK